MKKRTLKELPEKAKVIKVVGQGCLDDCQRVKVRGIAVYDIIAVACFRTVCTRTITHSPFWTKRF